MAASLFAALKKENVSAEYVTEYAKELTWNGYINALQNQISVLGEQWRRLVQLDGKVDVVINDSPILLCSIYAPSHYPPAFHELAAWCQNSLPSLNLFIHRAWQEYEEQGRRQTAAEAIGVDERILVACRDLEVSYERIGPLDEHIALSLIKSRLSRGGE